MSKELKEKTDKELDKMLTDAREDLRKFRFGVSGSKTRNIKEGRELRKKIARILTEVSKRNK